MFLLRKKRPAQASEPFPHLAKGGLGGVMRRPRRSKTTLVASRRVFELTGAGPYGEPLVATGGGPTPPNPPFARGGNGRNTIGRNKSAVQDHIFNTPS